MRMRFTVNPYYLLAHSIEKAWGNKPSLRWVKIVQKVQSSPLFIFKSRWETFAKINSGELLGRAFQKTESAFRVAMRTQEFKRILQETETYCAWVEKEWKQKGKYAIQLLKDIAGIKPPSTTVTVVITHPKLSNGAFIPKENLIFWGHPEEWKNYTIVYLCHELLHIFTHKKHSNERIMHAIIELATDNELRIRLNGKGTYFHEGKIEVGHPMLRKLERELLPLWQKYLRGTPGVKDIFDLEKKATRKLG